jgi:excisionase family DNA binding protein
VPDALQFLAELTDSPDTVFSADEVARWPAALFNELLGQGLLVPAETATHVTCDSCCGEHVEEVIFVESPSGNEKRAYIMCPEAGRVRVDLNRLRQWAVDIETLTSLTGWTPTRPEQDPIPDPIRMTITEAAKFVGVTDRTIREWRANGKLAVVEDENGHLVFSKSTLEMLRDSR